ncbi:MAG: glycosyltransferase family 2 protein [Candidatus Pacebacteria bacterium]|nr:glycosyltransferase family 2 protein [Candidatus Paceibacterota bacterium]MBT6756067.1 glycosyltransferase family 2 protein [Candidatus Paceibacterota bacterium]
MNKTEPFSTPIIFIFFNRSEHIVETLSVLQKLKPSKLYLVADGPRNNKERKQIQKVRKLVEKNIIWKTKVTKIYAHKNMGLRNRIVSGLNNVFEKEETAIIMEDDCIADQSFFKFCDVLLKKYKNNKKIGSITGDNFLFNQEKQKNSYYFSQYPHSWGWATWKRAWNLFDNEMSDWKTVWSKKQFTSPLVKWYWYLVFTLVTKLKIDSWAYRWTYSCFKNNLLTIIPRENLVQNKGVGKTATNTKLKNSVLDMKAYELSFPLKHPARVLQNKNYDALTEKNLYIKFRTIVGAILKFI